MKFSSLLASTALLLLAGCSTHHWAPVETSQLPPPPGPVVRHTTRIVVDVQPGTEANQCVVYQKHHPICFYNVRPALEQSLTRSLWPSFPEIIVGAADSARPGDYVLQVDLLLDALPPDNQGPGWSAGARGRFRLLRDGQVLSEQTTASRSRSHFAYGAPLGEGASEALDATVQHIAKAVFQVPEHKPDQPLLLPQVASRSFISEQATDPNKTKPGAASEETTTKSTDAQLAKTQRTDKK